MNLYLQLILCTTAHYCLVSAQTLYPGLTTSCGCPYATGEQTTSGGTVYDPSAGAGSSTPSGGEIYDPSSDCSTPSSNDSDGVYDILSPCSCSYGGGSDDEEDDEKEDDEEDDDDDDSDEEACSCDSSDPTCNCVLNCGCTTTGDNICADVELINKTFRNVVRGGPYTVLAIWNSDDHDQVDNICYTYFFLTGTDDAIVYISSTNIDGSNYIDNYIASDGGPGIVLAGGPEGVIKDKTYAEVSGCNTNLVYRCDLWGDDVNPNTRGYQYATYAISPLCASRNDSCGEAAVQAMIDAGYDQRYRVLPRKLPAQCVMSQPSTPVANTCEESTNCY